jgi:hypothetical protein
VEHPDAFGKELKMKKWNIISNGEN